jgi:hypothetical protein
MKKLLFLGACLVALASQPIMAQTGSDVVVVHFTRAGGGGGHFVATIAYEGGKTEVQDVKGDEAAEVKFAQQVIAKLYKQGYSLRGSFAPGFPSTNMLVFVKGQ